ncbi:GDSL-type esterase/lipase family protein [Pseudokineococcus lusitanus]|uniref:Lysophospholipase L1-like esterase n=1 Tax=Pseudokineococcus lusitanus TaxID=763993 RepID=A0A3N1HU59_9ACTN|nr:GDSL-type esterase/lipase family protein [Pseudokineococcus lusitanus]ROP45999.1 lysophospholipase L1-like esterase [Pseudokineococcus lusitanus]
MSTAPTDTGGLPPGRRICVLGDALVAGVGDPRALGWTGRVAARTPEDDDGPTTLFPLGVPGEGTSGLLERWVGEAGRRFAPGADNRVVVGLGSADLEAGLTMARSRLNLANVLDEAMSRGLPVLVVGPVPGLEGARNDDVAELADAFADVCARRAVRYVDCFDPLVHHEQWHADVAAGDGVHPGQAGYGLLAWLVLNGGWRPWLGLPDEG